MSEDPTEREGVPHDEKLCNSESTPEPPRVRREGFLSEGQDPLRDSGVAPLNVSSFNGSEQFRHEFIRGAEALGLNTKRKPIRPQQYVLADALNATGPDGLPLHTVTAVCIPRRASKSTSIFSVALGRCLEREDYLVAYTAQSGTKARDRFLKDLVLPLERMYPDEDTRPFKINRSRGGEHIRFTNGSLIQILPPISDSFRGDSYDLVIADEAQAHGPELSEDLLGAILPTFDTRPGAQLVVAGTTGEHRSGLLWEYLVKGREGKAGIVEYAAHPQTPIYDPDEHDSTENTTADPEVWQLAHPGIGNLTPLTAVQRNYEDLPRAQFLREYLGLWPDSSQALFVAPEKWEKCRVTDTQPAPPAHFVLGFAVDHQGLSASIVAAWRDEEGRSHLGIIEHKAGTRWVAKRLSELARKYRVPVVYDRASAENQTVITDLNRMTPRPKLVAQGWAQVSAAAALLTRDINNGALRHYDQAAMNVAAALVTKRVQPDSKRWSFRPPRNAEGADITPFEAGSLALREFDETPARGSMEMVI